MVNRALNVAAETNVDSAEASWARIMRASMPPSIKKKNAVTPYRIPMRLWSTVVIQAQMPVGARGRRNMLVFAAMSSNSFVVCFA
jgi:hypothetical protein